MKKRYIVAAIIIIALVAIYVGEYAVSRQYEFELVSSTSDVIVADGYSNMRITVRLTRNGKPVEGHIINIVCSNGTLPVSRLVTDKDGLIAIRYYAYLYLDDRLTPLDDVVFTLEDESNSAIFMVPAKGQFKFEAKKPEQELIWEDWQNITIDDETDEEGNDD